MGLEKVVLTTFMKERTFKTGTGVEIERLKSSTEDLD